MLMLIDTHDPRYPRRPDREPEPERRPRRLPHVPARLWVPLVAAIACLAATSWVPPLAGYVLAISSLFLFGCAAAVAMPNPDGLREHRQ